MHVLVGVIASRSGSARKWSMLRRPNAASCRVGLVVPTAADEVLLDEWVVVVE